MYIRVKVRTCAAAKLRSETIYLGSVDSSADGTHIGTALKTARISPSSGPLPKFDPRYGTVLYIESCAYHHYR